MTKVNKNIQSINYYTLAEFTDTLNLKDKEFINSVFKKSDTYNEVTGEKDYDLRLTTKEEINTFINGIGEEWYKKLTNFFVRKEKSDNIKDVINDSFSYDDKKYSKAIKSINIDNVMDMFERNRQINVGSKDLFIENSKGEYDHTFPRGKKVLDDLKYIRSVLKKYCKLNNIDTTKLDKLDFVLYKDEQGENYDSKGLIDKYVQHIKNTVYSRENIEPIFNQDNSKKLEDAILERFNNAIENNEKLYNNRVIEFQNSNATVEGEHVYDLGNGKLDKKIFQLTGNCWCCAALTALASSEKGRKLLENNIRRDNEHHITAVHLQEAENKDLPKPKGDGVYTFSDIEIINSQNDDNENSLVWGDGDYAAYNLAIEQYLKESTLYKRDNYMKGGKVGRVFEIITGIKNNESDSDLGINTRMYELYGGNSREPVSVTGFEELFDIIKNSKGCAVLGDESHAYSIVGASGENLLIQESNNDETWEQNQRFELVKGSNPPTYSLSEDKYEKYFKTCVVFRWQ